MFRKTARGDAGFTLVEFFAVLAIAVILLGGAVPSMQGLLELRRLEGCAGELATDFHWIRSEAVARNQRLRMRFDETPTGTCYVIHSGDSGACHCGSDGSAQCSTPDAHPLKTVMLPSATGVRLHSNVPSTSFDPTHGTHTPAMTATLTDSRGRSIRHVINIVGRVRSCSPDGSVRGYRPC